MKQFLALGLALAACQSPQEMPVQETVPSEWISTATIYEVNLRQYTPEGTINAFIPHLERLQKMGVKVLWVMPVQPIGLKNRKGPLGSYYSIRDYTAVNPEFGTLEDLKRMVDEAHARGMEVILDWVANHTAWDHPWMTEHPEWYTHDSTGAVVSPVADWSDVADLNYDEPALRQAMIDAMQFWIQEADVDGFRCDVAMMVPLDFWKAVRDSLDALKPVFMLAEAEGPQYFEHGFDMDYAWEMHHIMNQIAQGKEDATHLKAYFEKADSLNKPMNVRMAFTTNHDENSWNGTQQERMGLLGETMFVLACTAPRTMPLVYSGQEAGETHRLRFFAKDTISFADTTRFGFYRQALALKSHPALHNRAAGADWGWMAMEGNGLAFWRGQDSAKVIAAFNFSDGPLVLGIETDALKGSYTAFDGATVDLAMGQQLLIEPHGYLVLRSK